MSGLELPGFACNIMQVISFSREVVSLCSNVYQGKHPDAELADLAASLQAVSSDVQTSFDTINPKTADEKRLCDIATRCAIAARDLEEEVSFITSRQKQGSLASTLRIAAKTTWRKRRLDRLEKSLKEHERVLDTHLTVRVCKKADAIALRQKEGFDKLGADIQHFASQYALGHQKLRELVRTDLSLSQKESEKVMKAHVTEEITRSQVALLSHIDSKAEVTTGTITQNLHDLNIQTKDNSSCERLLQSLKYPAMDDRRNHLAEPREGTFKWVFSQHELSNDDNSNGVKTTRAAYRDPPWDNFGDWLKSDSDMYWISGKPGSGKSTFMKFLISNPLTREALRAWRPDVTILSHFFWKPGSMIQRNIKGLFASLLHQLLAPRQDILQAVLAGSRDLEQKDSNTDWSVKELQSFCLNTMRSYGSYICMFIDGLDEICDEDGVGALMEILNTIKLIPDVKICVASRPEQRLKRYLSRFPQLKLHDLTHEDIQHYADQTLRQSWRLRQDLSSRVLDEEILPELLRKAKGVFLWVRLAVRGLVHGIENDDSGSDLVLRLQDLPIDLSQMYNDMWTRLNGNTNIHRESTAKLLNLLIAYRYLIASGYSELRSSTGIPVIDIMGALDLPMQSRLFVDEQRPTTETIIHSCNQTRELMEVRCIGLVDIHQSDIRWHRKRVSAARLRLHASLSVDFVHRTAYEFLTDTEEGHRILSYDSSSSWERHLQLFKGKLLAATIAKGTSLGDMMSMIAEVGHSVRKEETHDLLKLCWKLYSRGLTSDYGNRLGRHFLSLATHPYLEDFLISSINKSLRPSALATQVLQEMLTMETYHWRQVSYFGCLTSLGAVPSLKGRLFQRMANGDVDSSSIARTISSLQMILERRIENYRYYDESFPDSFTNPSLGEYMQASQNYLTESSWMLLDVSKDHMRLHGISRIYVGGIVRRFSESRDNNKQHIFKGHSFVVELKSFLMLESLHRKQQSHQGRREPFTLVNFLEDPEQGPSCVRLRYFMFKAHTTPDDVGIEGCCRIRNRENVQPIEQLVKSWLLGETEGNPGESVREAMEHVCDEVAAGSTAYERIYGDLWEHLADDGFGMCKITKEEIDERIRHMQDEDPEAPGHWL
ncbi:hypothetical protein PFICI_03065 [Pestalotiopsis fici W106-1]|uniref:Nephrocystin 3-like N-terminal domain-containing protein n=1 Tax=Pestalotiopsis fici (strain W106-1 / CGMCC3.15140) TaxID=1229662 RepID=W3XG82_PESFW|nr:uncharacterized protein PFICI_03065 [Pestalotiopsis fici W106-1]ETS85040.1 hypothetical protein PFICI_03065 [Pestalotiopsis fici W106-1]